MSTSPAVEGLKTPPDPQFPDWNAINYVDSLSNGHMFAQKIIDDVSSDDGETMDSTANRTIAMLHRMLEELAEKSGSEPLKAEVREMLDVVTDGVMDVWHEGVAMGIRIESFRQSLVRDLKVKCPGCSGSGKQHGRDCRVCGATGLVRFWSFT